MLNLDRMNQIRLSARPFFQKFVAFTLLTPNYHLPPRVKINLEGTDNLLSEPVIYAMNHTDKFNYWPFQYRMYLGQNRFTATWVKGKYYQHPAMSKFMEWTNNIPTVSRGYLIAKDFALTMERAPTAEEYGALRALVDMTRSDDDVDFSNVPDQILNTPRNILGLYFDPRHEEYGECMDRLFRTMMKRFVALNKEAFDLGLDLIVFPQGTRSIRLSKGHVGLAQIALKYRKTVVPVGCNGCDLVYPGSSPFAKGGEVTYRIGKPIPYEEMKEFHIPEDFEPFTTEAEVKWKSRFQSYVDVVMDRINDLLDPRHQWSEDLESEGVQGSSRFV